MGGRGLGYNRGRVCVQDSGSIQRSCSVKVFGYHVGAFYIRSDGAHIRSAVPCGVTLAHALPVRPCIRLYPFLTLVPTNGGVQRGVQNLKQTPLMEGSETRTDGHTPSESGRGWRQATVVPAPGGKPPTQRHTCRFGLSWSKGGASRAFLSSYGPPAVGISPFLILLGLKNIISPHKGCETKARRACSDEMTMYPPV